ncbi:DUF202 domain-containing protein [Neolewinella agarilytica]|uniref:Putative membrane protein n=1 Tax=Neolewinella agarilytica TaxID=478744 RepID=A0A1H9P634_9BACT|nr:DUF202 domain-containing protein [Neolewinella agarilytica]SER43650.1 putative membrane protein [Neolewinella agarilytica]
MTIEDLGLTDRLALDRTHLANQRTLLAYTRTGIYLIFTSLGLLHLIHIDRDLHWIAWLAFILGGISILTGVINYFRMKRKINRLYK